MVVIVRETADPLPTAMLLRVHDESLLVYVRRWSKTDGPRWWTAPEVDSVPQWLTASITVERYM